MIPSQNSKQNNSKNMEDSIFFEKIDLLIQQKYNITIPALYFEFLSPENYDFDWNDIKTYYCQFGEVIEFMIKGKVSVVLYKYFQQAEVCKEYMKIDNNYKDALFKKNFLIRWFDYEKDRSILTPEMENIFEKIHNKNIMNIKDTNKIKNINIINNWNKNRINNGINNNINTNNNNLNNHNSNNINNPINNLNQNNQNQINLNGNSNQNNNSNNIFISPSIMIQYNQLKMNQGVQMNGLNMAGQNMHPMPNFSLHNMMMSPPLNMPLFMNQNLGSVNNMNGIPMNNHQYNMSQKQYNMNMEEKSYGKYTCKYEILIPNDKDFQVARRLIGSKGCNMKKILNECKMSNGINDNIKLRLRGRGSGYKEGPQNKESDEPLHLCISAKNPEEMKKACAKVDDLLNKIYEEYKKYCIKNNITPVAPQLANRIDCGNSLHKTK